MRFLPSKGAMALIGAAGLMAVMYSKRQRGAQLDGMGDTGQDTDESLASMVSASGPTGEPMPAQAYSGEFDEPTPEDPYRPGNPTTLPTGAAPGG